VNAKSGSFHQRVTKGCTCGKGKAFVKPGQSSLGQYAATAALQILICWLHGCRRSKSQRCLWAPSCWASSCSSSLGRVSADGFESCSCRCSPANGRNDCCHRLQLQCATREKLSVFTILVSAAVAVAALLQIMQRPPQLVSHRFERDSCTGQL